MKKYQSSKLIEEHIQTTSNLKMYPFLFFEFYFVVHIYKFKILLMFECDYFENFNSNVLTKIILK